MPRLDPSREVGMFPSIFRLCCRQKRPKINFALKCGRKSTRFHIITKSFNNPICGLLFCCLRGSYSEQHLLSQSQ